MLADLARTIPRLPIGIPILDTHSFSFSSSFFIVFSFSIRFICLCVSAFLLPSFVTFFSLLPFPHHIMYACLCPVPTYRAHLTGISEVILNLFSVSVSPSLSHLNGVWLKGRTVSYVTHIISSLVHVPPFLPSLPAA